LETQSRIGLGAGLKITFFQQNNVHNTSRHVRAVREDTPKNDSFKAGINLRAMSVKKLFPAWNSRSFVSPLIV